MGVSLLLYNKVFTIQMICRNKIVQYYFSKAKESTSEMS